MAAACLLLQLWRDDDGGGSGSNEDEPRSTAPVDDRVKLQVVQETLELMEFMQEQEQQAQEHRSRLTAGTGQGGNDDSNNNNNLLNRLCVGDRVEADYALEGTFYPAIVVEHTTETGDNEWVTVRYDDDGSTEALPRHRVRRVIPPTATQTSLGAPLLSLPQTDENGGNDDDDAIWSKYELHYELAQLQERLGDLESASLLYEQAADGALAAGKMKAASEWSLKAAAVLR